MKRTTRRILMAVLALVFVGSLGMLVYRNIEYKEGEEIYAEAETLVELISVALLRARIYNEKIALYDSRLC